MTRVWRGLLNDAPVIVVSLEHNVDRSRHKALEPAKESHFVDSSCIMDSQFLWRSDAAIVRATGGSGDDLSISRAENCSVIAVKE